MQNDEIEVVCGDHDLKNSDEVRNDQARKVKQIVVHPVYNPNNYWSDIAILVLQEDFELAAHLNVICLPTEKDFLGFDPKNCKAAGWGKDNSGELGDYQQKLSQVTLPYVDNAQCEPLLQNELGKHQNKAVQGGTANFACRFFL